ncbi:MAG: glutamine--fructose-6-phosphate transaminase (isomerizing) [Lachnospiraceae bacterium]|nr:glutamine--fructose-6-phosphate transaminase (isomerizing) [Lachnospiraceae bacterium]
MCGIVGYTGNEAAAPILLDGLSKLEYRGYDSAGIAVFDPESRETAVVRAPGRLLNLVQKTDGGAAVPGNCGIGHTRWATHGEPTEANAHPHHSAGDLVIGAHNGIIENYQELKQKLLRHDYTFYSDTDTEVAVNLVDYYYKKYNIGPIDAIAKAMVRIRGTYALALMFRDYPGEIWVARKDSPLIIGLTDDAALLASDVPAILKYTRTVYYIDNLEMARLTPGHVTFYDLNGDAVEKESTEITWDAEAAEKGGYEHFMLKEIHEQPKAVRDTLGCYIHDNVIDLSATGLTEEFMRSLERLYIIGCGSAYHVGAAGKYIIEDLADIPVETDLASEFRYRNPRFAKNSLMIVISQSGETADTLAALRMAKERGVPVLAVVNVVGSSIARECDYCMYTYAGPEIAVATTKAYSAQLVSIYMLAVRLGRLRGVLDEETYAADIAEMTALPDKMERVLEDKERIQWFASKFANAHDIFFVGRGADYAISLEGSLKMKEISYIHSEAYAAGELKHGTISLVEDGTLVIGVLTQKDLLEKTVSNMTECRARGAYLMGLTSYGNYFVEDSDDFTIYVPKAEEHFIGSLAIIPLQLLGYYTGVARGVDVDKPRNLAKSVTVE